uniref:Putative retrotransposon protein n=1 Tax=Tanacetum cinerariifolium TaxID=118510 RepID=A0A699GM17_TANCI|nr:putative retrotransposon protein [Tanacetum cinerariifolium]
MMNLTSLSLSFWDYALESATCILNMVPTKNVDMTPYELWRAVELEEIHDEDTSPSENTSEIPMHVEGFEPPQEEVILVRRSARTHQAPERLCLNVKVEEHSLKDLNEPTKYKVGMLDLKSNKWLDAINVKMQSIKDNQVRCLVDLPPNAFYDYEIWKMDVKTALLNGYLDEDIYMVDDIKSQTGYVFILNRSALVRKSSKQSTTVMSATEAEYIAASEAAMEAVCIRKFILGLGIVPTINKLIKIFCNNSTALLISNESGVQRGVRHYHRRYHYVRECIELGEINLLKVYTDDNLADLFTKALPKGKLTQHARSM